MPYLTPGEKGRGDAWAADAAAQGRRGTQRILYAGEVAAPAEVARLLGLAEGESVVVRRRLILLDDEPNELTDTYYPVGIARGTGLAGMAKIPGGAVTLLARLGHVGALVREDVTMRHPGHRGAGDPADRTGRTRAPADEGHSRPRRPPVPGRPHGDAGGAPATALRDRDRQRSRIRTARPAHPGTPAFPRPTCVRTAPMLAPMTSAIARASVAARAWSRIRKPHGGGDRGLQAHEDREGGRGQAAQREEFEGVGEDGGQDGDGGAQRERRRGDEPRARFDDPERQEQHRRDGHGQRQPVGLREPPPVRALKTMYRAHIKPAARAKATPSGSRSPKSPPPPRRKTPQRASPAHTMFTARRDARTESTSGPSTSRVTAGPRGIRARDW